MSEERGEDLANVSDSDDDSRYSSEMDIRVDSAPNEYCGSESDKSSKCYARKSSYQFQGLEENEMKDLRDKINNRERKRMNDLNSAMESLREVMPYSRGPSSRKLSKIATLSLAKNYIQTLTKSLDEMKRLIDDMYRSNSQTRLPSSLAPMYYPHFINGSGATGLSGYSPFPSTHHAPLSPCTSAACPCAQYPYLRSQGLPTTSLPYARPSFLRGTPVTSLDAIHKASIR